jgi:hypothetical protein
MKVTVNRPASPPAGYAGASGKYIRNHCENLFHDPDAPVPHSLAALTFEKQASCGDVRSLHLGDTGGRRVDMYHGRSRNSTSADGTNGVHVRDFLTELA